MRALWQWLIDLPGPILGGVVLVGAFLSALDSFLVLARQSRISQGIRTKVEANLGRAEENLKHTQAAIRGIEETIGEITGGDSYCYILPVADAITNELMFGVRVEASMGRKAYPLYDVTAEILDVDKGEQVGPPSSEAERQSRLRQENLRNLYRCRYCARVLPAWLPVAQRPNSAMHRTELRRYLDRMRTACIDAVIVETYEPLDLEVPR